MPWDAASFRKHNHRLSSGQAAKAAAQANAILKKTGDEGLAIATANKNARAWGGIVPHHDIGGMVTGPGGVPYPILGDQSGDVSLSTSPVSNYGASGPYPSVSVPNDWANFLFTPSQTPLAPTQPQGQGGRSSINTTGPSGGGNNNGGSGQPGVNTNPSQGAEFGDPNNTFGKIAFAGLNALNPLAGPLEGAVAAGEALSGKPVSMPPGIATAFGKAVGLIGPSIGGADANTASGSNVGGGAANSAGDTGPGIGDVGNPTSSGSTVGGGAANSIGGHQQGLTTNFGGVTQGVTSAAGPVGTGSNTSGISTVAGQGGQGGSGTAGNAGSCFLTTAVMHASGKGDDAPELTTLRWFRDNVLAKTPEGRELIRHYYAVAPDIVNALDKHKNAPAVYAHMRSFIDRAVQAVHSGRTADAIHIYGDLLRYAEAHAKGPAGHTHMNTGGVVPNRDMGGQIGGLTPTSVTQNPIVQSAWQRYAQMSPEQLQELAVRIPPGTQQGQLIQQALQQKHLMPQAQPTQAQQQPMKKGGGVPHAAQGMSMGMMAPWYTRAESREATSGLLHSTVAGRTDHINVSPPSGSYVIPADVMSGLGEGNTLAGARIFDDIFQTGPYGTSAGRGRGGHPFPAPPRAYTEPRAKGGGTGTHVLVAGGEYIVSPQDLIKKFGSVKNGHKILDKFVVSARKKIATKMAKLPGPEKS